jgi:hypothetical protein
VTEPNRTEPNRTEPNRTEPNHREKIREPTTEAAKSRARAFRLRRKERPTASERGWLAAYEDALPSGDDDDDPGDDDDDQGGDDDEPDDDDAPAEAPRAAARPPRAAPRARAAPSDDENMAGIIDAARRSMDASLAWMQRACAQFERSAQLSTARAAQSERQLVSALASMAAREADRAERELLAPERDDDDDEPEAAAPDAGAALDAQLMGSLMQRLVAPKTPPKAPA